MNLPRVLKPNRESCPLKRYGACKRDVCAVLNPKKYRECMEEE